MLDREVFKHDGQNANVVDGVGLHQRAKWALSKGVLAFPGRIVVRIRVLAAYRVLALAGNIFGQFATSFDVPTLSLFLFLPTVGPVSSVLDQRPRVDSLFRKISPHPLREGVVQ